MIFDIFQYCNNANAELLQPHFIQVIDDNEKDKAVHYVVTFIS